MSTLAMPQTLPVHCVPPDGGAELLDFVDFTWLMAGEGHRIDLDRLRDDHAYASGCLALARGSTSATLRAAGTRLARWLGRVPD